MTPFSTLPAFPTQALAAAEARANAEPTPLARHMRRGAELHRSGLPEFALVAFEQALVLASAGTGQAALQDAANAASACAAVLLQAGRPVAAYTCLKPYETILQRTAEGASNLALVAAFSGRPTQARELFGRALALDPGHIRALAGLARLGADEGDWELALPMAARYAALQPQLLEAHVLLIDSLLLARRPSDALRATAAALERLPGQAFLAVRKGLAHACLGAWDMARPVLAKVDTALARRTFTTLGFRLASDEQAMDVMALYLQYAADCLAEAEWLYSNALPQTARALLGAPGAASPLAWAALRPAAQVLDLDEREIAAVHAHTDTCAMTSEKAMAPSRRVGDARLRIGFFSPRLDTDAAANWLAQQLAPHDRSRFSLHVYAQSPAPLLRFAQPVQRHADTFTEVAHMTDAELVARLRLDTLDLLVDLSTDTRDARPAVIGRRIATVQVRNASSFPVHPAAAFDYGVSDVFVHAGSAPGSAGALVRLPFSAYGVPGTGSLAQQASPDQGDGAFCFRVNTAPASIDRETFGVWMQILKAVPHARLLFPAYRMDVRARLRRQALQHEVDPDRLGFADGDAGTAGLLLDPLRRSEPRAVVEGLMRGLPAVACAGPRTSARAGAGVLYAAGLEMAVASDAAEYVALTTRLAQQPSAMEALRLALRAATSSAPLWDTASRARELESAWVHMIRHIQSGLPPAAFDVEAGATPHELPPALPPIQAAS